MWAYIQYLAGTTLGLLIIILANSVGNTKIGHSLSKAK